jgi:predicted RNase H-like HicB family nuclease
VSDVKMNDLRIFKSEGWRVAEIPSLHVVTRGKTIKELKKNLNEAVQLAVESLVQLKTMKVAPLNA